MARRSNTPMKMLRTRLLLVLLISAVFLLGHASPALGQANKPPIVPVSSPINLSFEVSCENVASVQVVLDDEAKDIIARQIIVPDCQNKTNQVIHTKVYFDTFERLTPAHLSISSFDAETRWIWMKSENIVFTDKRTPMQYSFASENPLSITLPLDGTAVTERTFIVIGSIQVGLSRSAYFELVSDTGLVLGSALLTIPSSVIEGQWDFEFPFSISRNNYVGGARLTMQQYGVDIFGIESLNSVLLTIDL